jgi:hypothetical protein
MKVPLQENLWDKETKIHEIGDYRHTVIFPDWNGEPTKVTFCNNCGCPFIIGNRCAECGIEQKT